MEYELTIIKQIGGELELWLIKSEEETDPRYGKRPEDRTIEESIKNSVLIVDKHKDPTSQTITDLVKKIFQVKKAGHSGTLEKN